MVADVRAVVPADWETALVPSAVSDLGASPSRRPPGGPRNLLACLTQAPGRASRVTHVEHLPQRAARTVDWPSWADVHVVEALRRRGIDAPWEHQVVAATHAWEGRSVVVSTGTASGKSLAYLLPALSAIRAGRGDQGGRGATALYLSPTKALAADQARILARLDVPGVTAATYDGDTPREARDWAREQAAYLLTNPDMVHRGLLPAHPRWAGFLRSLRFVIVDECHGYRGVFGSHVGQVLRRLRRVAAAYGAAPTFVLASATVAEPEATAGVLTGVPVRAVTEDASPRGATEFALWQPPLVRGSAPRAPADQPDERDTGTAEPAVSSTTIVDTAGPSFFRRSAVAEAAELLGDLVAEGARTVVFVRSRRAAEVTALLARDGLARVEAELAGRVAAYRAGYLPEERRRLEAALHSGELLGVAATRALELGVDVSGLDAVVLAGFPGTRASLWQQAGRAGREGTGALVVLVARDDPLDTYLVHHPEAVFGRPSEATVLDPDNPHVLGPHLCAAAQERPLAAAELVEVFGPGAPGLVADLESRGLLRRRPGGWYWTRREWAADLVDLRGSGGPPVRLVEDGTGRLLGTVDAVAAPSAIHAGAVYLHQGESYLVRELDLSRSLAFVRRAEPDYATTAREVSDVRLAEVERTTAWGEGELGFGTVEVTAQVVGYVRRRVGSGELLGEEALDLPPRLLSTKAVWWTLSPAQLATSGVAVADLPGAAHAAEHASIGLLPLVAQCDRWDVGGVSTAWHPDTGRLTVVVHDGLPGGAGFADRGYRAAATWLSATRDAIASCECAGGCPSCVHSPKCGNGNQPLDKHGARRLLEVLLAGADAQHRDR